MDEDSSQRQPKTSSLKERSKRDSESSHLFKKRVPPRDSKRPNDVYITNKSDFKGQLSSCLKILEGCEEGEVILHGLGAAVPRTVNLALQLEEKLSGFCTLHVQTQTVKLVDDLELVKDSFEPSYQTRSNSSVTIRIVKKKT